MSAAWQSAIQVALHASCQNCTTTAVKAVAKYRQAKAQLKQANTWTHNVQKHAAYPCKRVDGSVQYLSRVLHLFARQSSLEEANAQRLAHPLVCILACQDVLILQTNTRLTQHAQLSKRQCCMLEQAIPHMLSQVTADQSSCDDAVSELQHWQGYSICRADKKWTKGYD